MQAIFNELSASQLPDLKETQVFELLLNLIQTCMKLRALDYSFKLRINQKFWYTQLDDYGSIYEYLNNSKELNDALYFLLAITDSPYLPDGDIDINSEMFLAEDLFWDNILISPDSGIRTAYAFQPNPAPLISFATNDWSDRHFVKVKKGSNFVLKIINIASSKHIFEIHFEKIVAEYLETKVSRPTSANVNDILPNKEISNLYLEHCKVYTMREKRIVLNTDISMNPTKINEIGNVVALANGWIKHTKYSLLNDREVFSHKKNKNIFIAIDKEKGDFEVHNSDKNTNHLGAISFNGAKTEKPKGHKLKFE